MKGRKYERYEVKVQYRDGSVEYIRYNGVNTSNYKDMIKVYKDTKETHENDGKVESISFIGISNTGELNVFWQKNIEIKYKEELNTDCRDIVNNIQNEINLLQNQLSHHKNMIKIYEKKENTLLHMIENNKNNKYCSEEDGINFKLKMFDAIENIRVMRRYSKDQIADLNNIIYKFKELDLEPFVKNRKIKNITSNEYKNHTELNVYYKDEQEKSIMIEKYKNEYDKYIIDESCGLIYFYNISSIGKNYKERKEKLNKKLSKNSRRIV